MCTSIKKKIKRVDTAHHTHTPSSFSEILRFSLIHNIPLRHTHIQNTNSYTGTHSGYSEKDNKSI